MRRPHSATSMALEVLHGTLVLLGRRPRLEGAEIATPAGFRVQLAGIEPIAARLELADHRRLPSALRIMRACPALRCACHREPPARVWFLSTATRGQRFHVPWRRRGAYKGAGADNTVPADVTSRLQAGA